MIAITVLSELNCAACQVMFAIPQDFMTRRREDHKIFFCPNGHENHYPQENDKERLQKELERVKNQSQFYEERSNRYFQEKKALERRRRSQKAVATVLRRKLQGA